MSAPDAQRRRACWRARDELWKCLDYNGDDVASCEEHKTQFEVNCPAQWVKYFSKRRDYLKYKEKLETNGFEPAEGTTKL